MLHQFKTILGHAVEPISCQDRLGYYLSDTMDAYELMEEAKEDYGGNEITFYDFESRETYIPFSKQTNVIYDTPVFSEGFYYFLQIDKNAGKIRLIRFLPPAELQTVTTLGLEGIDSYNLRLLGEGVHIVSDDDCFSCYFPEKFSFQHPGNEVVVFIDEGKAYCNAWFENGVDEKGNIILNDYEYYEKLVVRDYAGKIISEQRGTLFQRPNGEWWVS